MRRQFLLPEADLEYLDFLGLAWETVKENDVMRLIIHDFSLPSGYDHQKVSILLRIEASYPDTQIDMVYISPGLSRLDGKGISALASESFDGKSWQRWSRHRTSQNPWRPGIDNIATHMLLVEDWIKREFRNNP
jgi:hypothetical protein